MGVNDTASLVAYTFFTVVMLLVSFGAYEHGADEGASVGIFVSIFWIIISGVLFHFSKKDDKNNEKGQKYYKGILIANGVVMSIHTIIGIFMLIDYVLTGSESNA
jgi:amino acid transporter